MKQVLILFLFVQETLYLNNRCKLAGLRLLWFEPLCVARDQGAVTTKTSHTFSSPKFAIYKNVLIVTNILSPCRVMSRLVWPIRKVITNRRSTIHVIRHTFAGLIQMGPSHVTSYIYHETHHSKYWHYLSVG